MLWGGAAPTVSRRPEPNGNASDELSDNLAHALQLLRDGAR